MALSWARPTGHDRVATHPPGNDDSHVWAGASPTGINGAQRPGSQLSLSRESRGVSRVRVRMWSAPDQLARRRRRRQTTAPTVAPYATWSATCGSWAAPGCGGTGGRSPRGRAQRSRTPPARRTRRPLPRQDGSKHMAHPSERATWTGAAASSRRLARCSRGDTKVPAASDGSSGRPSASSAQSVEGAPLMTAAKEPAARPSRNASRPITFASFPQARIHVLCAPLVGALADFRVGRAASVRRPDAARCCFAWKARAEPTTCMAVAPRAKR